MAVFERKPSGELVLQSLTRRCGGCGADAVVAELNTESEPEPETETNDTEVDDHASGH